MRPIRVVEEEWEFIRTLLPENLEKSAREMNALARARGVPNAEALVRLCLAYGLTDLSLKDVAAWASSSGVARVSGPGLFYRLVESEAWLEWLLAEVLRDEVTTPSGRHVLRVVDATVVTGPKADGADWKAHVVIDPASGGFVRVEITDRYGGESLWRHSFSAGDIVLGDRGYAMANGIWSVVSNGGHVVVRLNPHSIRVFDTERRPISLMQLGSEVPRVGAITHKVEVPIPPEKVRRGKSHKPWKTADAIGWVSARAIACRTRTGSVVWVGTTVPEAELDSVQVLELYRLRWQIELLFKRLKSLLGLSKLPTRSGPTARSWLVSRFLAAAMAQKFVRPTGPLSPWGYRIPRARATA